MTQLKLKQLNSTNATEGGTIVFDGSKLVYSNNFAGSINLPVGTTAERPVTNTIGQLRYNTDLNTVESYFPTGWDAIVQTSDLRLQRKNLLIVQKDPGVGEFGSIKDAMDSITNNSPNNAFVIEVYPGIYNEDPITWKESVFIKGVSPYVEITANDNTTELFNINGITNGGIRDMVISGVDDITTQALSIKDTLNFDIGNIIGKENANFIKITGDVTETTVKFRQILCELDSITNNVVTVDGTNNNTQLLGIAFNVFGSQASSLDNVLKITGNNTDIQIGTFSLDIDATPGDGVVINNGGSLFMSSGIIRNFDTGLLVENIGSGPFIKIEATIFEESITNDIDVSNPNTVGYLNCSANNTKVDIDTNSSVSAMIFGINPGNGGIDLSGELFLSNSDGNFNQITSVNDLILNGGTMGVFGTRKISDGGSGTIDVAEGFGYLEISGTTVYHKRVEWPNTNLSLPNDGNFYIFVENTNNVTFSTSKPNTERNILLGRVTTYNGSIEYINDTPIIGEHSYNKIDNFIRDAIGSVYDSGSIVSENTTTNRALDVTNGEWYYAQNKFNPSGGTNISWDEFYHSSGTFTKSENQTLVDNTQYDDGTELVPLTTGYYTKHVLYTLGDGSEEKYILVYGQEEFSTLAEAEDSTLPLPPGEIDRDNPSIAAIVVQEGNDNIINILDVRPVIGFQSPGTIGTSDHGSLQGLLDDDHPQYLLVSGNRTMNGNLDMGGNSIINVNTVDNVDVSSHSSRHLPNGNDPLTTGVASSLNETTTNTEGIQNSFARSDHTHSINGFISNIEDSGSIITTSAETLNFIGNLTAVDSGGGTVNISTSGQPDQNIWETINSDSGSTTADSITDTLTISGGTGIETSVSGDNLSISFVGTFQRAEVSTSTYVVQDSDSYVGINSNTETVVTLPASPIEGKRLIIKDEIGQAKNNIITIDGNGNNIDEKATINFAINYGSVQLIFAGSEWRII